MTKRIGKIPISARTGKDARRLYAKHEKWKALCTIREYLKMNLKLIDEEIEELMK